MAYKWQLEYALDVAETTLHWFEDAANHRPGSVVGHIGGVTILGNVLTVDAELTPEMMKMILEHNRDKLISKINILKTKIKECEK
jgi:hypothetical protein